MIMNDNWKHRSSGMACSTCMFFVEKEISRPVDPRAEGDERPPLRLGRCRRHAPTMSGFPAVFGNDWCGDHKLDENSI